MKQVKADKLSDKEVSTDKFQEEIKALQDQLNSAKEREKRVLADYQNLQRRSAQEKLIFIKMANKDLCQALLQPLEHLSMAATTIKDQGLNMVLEQFWRELGNFGLVEIEVLGKNFDLRTMEVIDKRGDGEKVVEVVRRGYMLNGEVIQHAQVILA